MSSPIIEFDLENYQLINRARELWLRPIIEAIPFRSELSTALDLGCGAGYFAGVLQESGFQVTALDLQEENLQICRQRYPGIHFGQIDLDSETPPGTHDLVLLFGILYHLQSPLQTILRLQQVVRRLAIVETRVAAGEQMACYLFNENQGPAHNRARVTAVPTFPAFVSLFQQAGFDYVYRPAVQPAHDQWQSGQNGQRHNFIVAREALDVAGWHRVEARRFLNKWEALDAH